jgi:hypothetical protein
LSSLLRGDSIGMLEVRPGDIPTPLLRMIGTRVLRGEHVGLQKPLSLSVPSASHVPGAVLAESVVEEEAPPLPLPPDFAVLEEAARTQGYNVGYEQGNAAGMAAAEVSMTESV